MNIQLDSPITIEFDEDVFSEACQAVVEMRESHTPEVLEAILATLILRRIEKTNPGKIEKALKSRKKK